MVASLQAMGVFSFRSILDQRHNKYDLTISSAVLDTKIQIEYKKEQHARDL